jgi:hypothetical protein
MYTTKLHARIDDRHLRLELPPDAPKGEAEIVVLIEPDSSPETPSMSLQEISAWLKTLPPSNRSAEDFEAQITAERAAWGED